MSYAERHSVTVTTAADGSATAYIGGADGAGTLTGRVITIIYTKTDFADGSTFTVTSEATGEGIWTETGVNASAVRAPRQPTHGNDDGVTAKYASGGTLVRDYIVLANDRIKIVISGGGNAKTGAFTVVMG